jgi:hypothetical protein
MNENIALIEKKKAETEENDENVSLSLKKTNSLLEYILNHRQDILDRVENERKSMSGGESSVPKTEPIPQTEIYELKKKMEYLTMIRWYIIFVIYGFLGGITINALSRVQIINYDMIFNVIISPIIYYHSPRNSLTNISIINFFKFYTSFFFIGLGFRFLDHIPGFDDFTLDPTNITTASQIGITFLVMVLLCLLSGYFIVISSEPVLHLILFLIEVSIVVSTSYFFIINNGRIHVHHYFIGLVLMLVSKNYHSKIVIITHAVAYAIYIEGISKWGIATIYWKEEAIGG